LEKAAKAAEDSEAGRQDPNKPACQEGTLLSQKSYTFREGQLVATQRLPWRNITAAEK